MFKIFVQMQIISNFLYRHILAAKSYTLLYSDKLSYHVAYIESPDASAASAVPVLVIETFALRFITKFIMLSTKHAR